MVGFDKYLLHFPAKKRRCKKCYSPLATLQLCPSSIYLIDTCCKRNRHPSPSTMDQAIELGQSQNASLRDSQNASPRDSLSFQSVEEPLRTTSLAPVDKGLAAWTFLAAATMLESLVWGLPFSVGVLHTYWTTEMFPPGTPGESLVTVAATL
jgi:hypothetical protein